MVKIYFLFRKKYNRNVPNTKGKLKKKKKLCILKLLIVLIERTTPFSGGRDGTWLVVFRGAKF